MKQLSDKLDEFYFCSGIFNSNAQWPSHIETGQLICQDPVKQIWWTIFLEVVNVRVSGAKNLVFPNKMNDAFAEMLLSIQYCFELQYSAGYLFHSMLYMNHFSVPKVVSLISMEFLHFPLFT